MDKEVLGARIRKLRKQRKMSMEGFAEKAKITPTFLGQIERGVKMPSLTTFVKIVNALGISPDVLLYDQVNEAKPHILNEITEKVKDLSPSRIKMVNDMLDVMLENFVREDASSGESE